MCSEIVLCGVAQSSGRGEGGALAFARLGMALREVFGMPASAKVGRTDAGTGRSAGEAWAEAEAERPWELRAEGLVDDRGGPFGVALSGRVYDFVAESGKSVNIREAKK